MGRKSALLIGNGLYNSLPRLGKHKTNVSELDKVLDNPHIGAFVTPHTDTAAKLIKKYIEDFLGEREESDFLLLYFSGCGVIGNKSQWYFTCADSDEEQLSTTAISATFLKGAIEKCSSKYLVVIIDACFERVEDAAKGIEIIKKELMSSNRTVLVANTVEKEWQGDPTSSLSAFTSYLVRGLEAGVIEDKNEEITIGAWLDYTEAQMGRVTSHLWKQITPQAQEHILVSPSAKASEAIDASKIQHDVVPATTEHTAQTFSVGGHSINLIILARGDYAPQNIQCSYRRDNNLYDHLPEHLPPDLQSRRRDYESNINKQKTRGVLGLPYNSPMYKLLEFDTGNRVISVSDGEEIPVLLLKFSPTDYFSQIVTDLAVGNPIREKYRAKAGPITEHPVPEFSTILGVNLNVITADNYLIITERSKRAKVAGNKLHTSVGENLLRSRDAGRTNAPDPFRAAIRGAKEELGLTLNEGDIMFKSFTVIPDFCQYSLIATVHIQETRLQVEKLWHSVVPPDKWESRGLLFYEHRPDIIAQFAVSTWERWFSVAIAAVVLSLVDVGYAWEEIDNAFSKAWSKLKK